MCLGTQVNLFTIYSIQGGLVATKPRSASMHNRNLRSEGEDRSTARLQWSYSGVALAVSGQIHCLWVLGAGRPATGSDGLL